MGLLADKYPRYNSILPNSKRLLFEMVMQNGAEFSDMPIIEKRLAETPRLRDECETLDPICYLRAYIEGTSAEWYIIEVGEDEDPSMAFGYCDIGLGFPELGYVDLQEVFSFKNAYFDLDFKPTVLSEVKKQVAQKYGGWTC